VQNQERLQNRIKIKHINSTNGNVNPSILPRNFNWYDGVSKWKLPEKIRDRDGDETWSDKSLEYKKRKKMLLQGWRRRIMAKNEKMATDDVDTLMNSTDDESKTGEMGTDGNRMGGRRKKRRRKTRRKKRRKKRKTKRRKRRRTRKY
jgi:hypothetical protein